MSLTPKEVKEILDTPEGRIKLGKLMVEPLQKALGFTPFQKNLIPQAR